MQNNYQRIPTKNDADPENIPLSKEQNQSHKPTSSTSVPIQLQNSKQATSRNQKTRYQNKETPHYPQDVLQKSVLPRNVPAEERKRWWPDGTQSSAQSDDCRISRVREKFNSLPSTICTQP